MFVLSVQSHLSRRASEVTLKVGFQPWFLRGPHSPAEWSIGGGDTGPAKDTSRCGPPTVQVALVGRRRRLGLLTES